MYRLHYSCRSISVIGMSPNIFHGTQFLRATDLLVGIIQADVSSDHK